jgi:hypothetical protein
VLVLVHSCRKCHIQLEVREDDEVDLILMYPILHIIIRVVKVLEQILALL